MKIKDKYADDIKWSVDLRKGSYQDEVAGVSHAIGGSSNFANTKRGRALRFNGVDTTLDAAAGSYPTTGDHTLSMWVYMEEYDNLLRLFIIGSGSEAEALNNTCEVAMNPSGELYAIVHEYGLGTNETTTMVGEQPLPLNEWFHLVQVRDVSESRYTHYVNGVEDGTGTYTNQPTGGGSGTIKLGYSFFQSPHLLGYISDAFYMHRALTAEEVAQLYTETEAEAHITKIPEKTVLPEASVTKNPLSALPAMAFDMSLTNALTLTDLSGNGNNGTLSGCTSVDGIIGNALHLDGDEDNVATGFDLNADSNFSFAAWIKLDQTATSIGHHMYLFDNLYQHSANDYFYIHATNDYFDAPADIVPGEWVHIVYTQAGQTTTAKLYINGADTGQVISGAEIIPAMTNMYLGRRDADNTRNFNGCMDSVQVFNAALTADDVLALYEVGQRRLGLYKPGEEWEETLSTVTSGFISNTGFFMNTGNYDVTSSADLGTKVLTDSGIAACVAGTPTTGAYGTWEWDWYKDSDVTEVRVLLLANKIATVTDSDLNCYQLRFNASERLAFSKIASGVDTALGYTASSYASLNTWYTMRLTRDYDGAFTMYYKETDGGTWTLIDVSGGAGSNPVTNTDFTTGSYLVVDNDGRGDSVGNFKYWPIVKNPLI